MPSRWYLRQVRPTGAQPKAPWGVCGVMGDGQRATPAPDGEARASFEVGLSVAEAVALFDLVARSPSTNGLVDVYVALGEFVRDENGHVPTAVAYTCPRWAKPADLAFSASPLPGVVDGEGA